MSSILSAPHFHDEATAYEFVEARTWPNGPACPHCGATDRIGKMQGKATRTGTYKCYHCRKQFTVKVGTVFEASHVPMHKWLQAIALMSSSKKGMSSNQLYRILGVTLKTAWFMSHRIREAMRSGSLSPLGGNGKVVEADETYFGKQADPKPSSRRKGRPYLTKGGGPAGKRAILGLIERGGHVRTFHVIQATKVNVGKLVQENIDRESALNTDESQLYRGMGSVFSDHPTVRHSSGEYVRGTVHSNTIEKAISASSSAACAAPTSTVPRNICTAIWRNSISGITTASHLALTMPLALTRLLQA